MPKTRGKIKKSALEKWFEDYTDNYRSNIQDSVDAELRHAGARPSPYDLKRIEESRKAQDEYERARDIRLLERVIGIPNTTDMMDDERMSVDTHFLGDELGPFMMSQEFPKEEQLMTPTTREEILAQLSPETSKGGGVGSPRTAPINNRFEDIENLEEPTESTFINPILAETIDQSMKRKGLASNLRGIVERQGKKGGTEDVRSQLLNLKAKQIDRELSHQFKMKELQNDIFKNQFKADIELQKIASNEAIEMKKMAVQLMTKNAEFANKENVAMIESYIKLLNNQAQTGDEASLVHMRDFANRLKDAVKTNDASGVVQEAASAVNDSQARLSTQPIATNEEIAKGFADQFIEQGTPAYHLKK